MYFSFFYQLQPMVSFANCFHQRPRGLRGISGRRLTKFLEYKSASAPNNKAGYMNASDRNSVKDYLDTFGRDCNTLDHIS
jgi:hypothetical protein